jgi:hypothetical protein
VRRNKYIAETKARLPFTFSFGGLSYKRLMLVSDGAIGFLPPRWTQSHAINQGLITVLNVVQSFARPESRMLTSVVGTAPNRVFVIEWRDMDALPTGQHLTYEAKLHENGDIDFLYQTISSGLTDYPRAMELFTNQVDAPFFEFSLPGGQNPPFDGVAIHLAAS